MKKIWIGLAIFFVVAGVAGMIADSGSTKKKAEEMRNYPVISCLLYKSDAADDV